MSQENSEVILQQARAFNRRDVEGFVALVSPDVEWEDSAWWSETARIYRGRAGVREWFNQILEPWESLLIRIGEITEAADGRLLFEGFLTASDRGSQVDTLIRSSYPRPGRSRGWAFWSVCWLADGKIKRRQVFRDRAERLTAAGGRE
jgi:ketosteroid isomerase-like protein